MATSELRSFIESIELTNFRKFEHRKLEFHHDVTALIGNNATGKSSVLHALAILLNTYFFRSGVNGGYVGIKEVDRFQKIRVIGGEVTVEKPGKSMLSASGHVHGEFVSWSRKLKDRGGSAPQLIRLASDVRKQVADGVDVDLPVVQFYGIGRLWSTHFKNKGIGKPESRLAAYKNCLDPRSDQKTMTKWFSRLEMSAWQQNAKIPVLESVRKAVISCLPEVNHFYYDANYSELMIRFEEGVLQPFSMLSDGYRNTIGMVADIAHRAARLNPHMGENANESSGIVLIDEVDLHLHPSWQRSIIGDLKKTFPNIQFIITTHSPFILQSLNEGKVINLNKEQDEECCFDAKLDGESIEDIVEEKMGVDTPQRSKRFQDMYEAAQEYYLVLKEGKDASPERKEKLKQQLDELSAPFSDNIAYSAFFGDGTGCRRIWEIQERREVLMRPVERGPHPKDDSGEDIIFKKYNEACPYLIRQMGNFCSYCEMELKSALHVEHVKPKKEGLHPELELVWSNFLLACVHCNSRKKDTNVNLEDYFWPDTSNPMLFLDYNDGLVSIAEGLSEDDKSRAERTVALTGLDNEPDPNEPDKRFFHRLDAWGMAVRNKERLGRNDNDDFRSTLAELASAKGFFSVWMSVFKDDADMCRRFIEALPGTCKECFDAEDNYKPIPRSNEED